MAEENKFDPTALTLEQAAKLLGVGREMLEADAAASADVRRTLHSRARYEVANNSYARGIVLTLANDTVGTGLRL